MLAYLPVSQLKRDLLRIYCLVTPGWTDLFDDPNDVVGCRNTIDIVLRWI